MNIKFTGRHFDITDALKEHAEKKTSKFKHFFDVINEIDLVMEKENTIFKASATFDVNKKRFHIETKEQDMYESVDKLMDKIERKVRRFRDKVTDHHRKSISEASAEVEGEL
ncbi:MAG: ribosome hibernation-promoting factor, HPF/YfiA family [bacterium]